MVIENSVEANFLRKKYPRFIYKKYSYKISGKNLEIFFDFLIEPKIKFRPKIVIENIDKKQIKEVGDRVLNNLIFHLGLIELLSYWKSTCSPEIIIKAGFLNSEQIKWWKDLIIQGMGQFFYENKIDFSQPGFLKIISKNNKNFKKFSKKLKKDKFLIAMGEGKDSIVTLELLKKKKLYLSCFVVNPNKIHFKILKKASITNPIIVERKIDPKLLESNRKGFLNGHTPVTASHSFLAVFCALLFNFSRVVFSNEKSSDEGNLKYLGKTINHQYSKSSDFEKKFQNYIKKYLASDIDYFSFLRPLSEIQIAKIFSKLPQYFPLFLSCNEAKKTYSGTEKPTLKWCCKCSKCLFVFTILYPFLEEKQLIKIFGKNLFNDKNLLPIMKELIGKKGFKPFECVGTKKETLVAFYLSWKKNRDLVSIKLPFLLEYFEKKILNSLPRRISSISEKFLRAWNDQQNLPKKFEKILKALLLTEIE